MKKLKMEATSSITFKEGCEKYLEDCMQRNLRDGSLTHYKHSYRQMRDGYHSLKCRL